MRICVGCARHVFVRDPRCPFCGHTLRTSPAPAFAIVFLGLALTGCSDGAAPSSDSDGTETTDSSSTSTQTSSVTDDNDGSGDGDGDGDGDSCGVFYGGGCYDVTPSCDPGTQDCPDGEKCTAYVMTPGYCCVDANKCVPIVGDKQLGDPCERMEENDDCAKGLFCLGESTGSPGPGVCRQLCDYNDPMFCADAGLPDAECLVLNDGVLPLCETLCDPLAQDCGAPEGCYAVGALGFVCRLPANEEGMGLDGDDCYEINSCEVGLVCANGGVQEGCQTDACCTPLCQCDPNMPDGIDAAECTGAEQCLCYYMENAPQGYETVGLCAVPP